MMKLSNTLLQLMEYDRAHQTPKLAGLYTALTEGYAAALHKTRTYIPELGSAATQQFLIKDLRRLISVHGESSIAMNYEAMIATDLLDSGSDRSTANHLFTDIYLCGYKLGLHRSGKYDDALYLSGHELLTCVLCDLLAFDEKRENAAKAQARIVVEKYGFDREQFEKMVFGRDKGNEVTAV